MGLKRFKYMVMGYSIVAKLILFTGKGGVGKSSVSAATAFHHSNEGRRVILVSSDPAHSTEDVVGRR